MSKGATHITKKRCFNKGPETEKKVWLKWWLNPRLSWLTTICLRGFDRNVPQLFPVFRLHQKYRLAINIFEFPDHMHPWNSDIKVEFQTMCMQKVWFLEKKICLPAGFEPATWMQVSCTTHWVICAVVFNGLLLKFLQFFVFNPLQNASWLLHYLVAINLKEEDDWFMESGSWYVNVNSPRQVISVTDRQMDEQLFSFIYTVECRIV